MADARISALTLASALDGTEEAVIVQDATTKRTPISTLLAQKTEALGMACSDEVTSISAGSNKVRFRMPYALTLTSVRASLGVAQTSGTILTVDINKDGTSILSTKLTVDNNEQSSTTAAAAAAISDTALTDDCEITVDVDQAGTGAKGLKIWLIGTRA